MFQLKPVTPSLCLLFLTLFIVQPAQAWQVTPTQVSGTESQSVSFDVIVDADEWSPAGTLCSSASWDFEFQLGGTLVDGTAEWGADLSSPFVGGALTRICSNQEEELVTRYTIAMIEDFVAEDSETAEIVFEHCEPGEGSQTCTQQTLDIEVIEVAGGGLPEVGIVEVSDAAEPATDGQFRLFLESPAPNGGVTVLMHFSGTATAGDDYVGLLSTVFIPEGSSQALVDIEVINDGLLEGTETVMITLLESPDYRVGYQLARATILIEDDDGENTLIINQGISDAWFNSETPGQGFFIIVYPEIGKVFLAWFTYDVERPPKEVSAILGDPGHRWITALGDFAGNTAVLEVEITEGGVFNAVPPQTSQHLDGTITLEFIDCLNGLVHFNIPSLGLTGSIPIERLTLDNVALCQSLAASG